MFTNTELLVSDWVFSLGNIKLKTQYSEAQYLEQVKVFIIYLCIYFFFFSFSAVKMMERLHTEEVVAFKPSEHRLLRSGAARPADCRRDRRHSVRPQPRGRRREGTWWESGFMVNIQHMFFWWSRSVCVDVLSLWSVGPGVSGQAAPSQRHTRTWKTRWGEF